MNAIRLFRAVSFVEGISYLLLVFIAMPAKYMFDQPALVRVVGAAHGGLFVIFVLALIAAVYVRRWSLATPVIFFVVSMVPFGFLYIEHQLRKELVAESQGPNP